MALVIEANYSKKVGLPGYSSHQFSLTLKAEITDINQVPAESARLVNAGRKVRRVALEK